MKVFFNKFLNGKLSKFFIIIALQTVELLFCQHRDSHSEWLQIKYNNNIEERSQSLLLNITFALLLQAYELV